MNITFNIQNYVLYLGTDCTCTCSGALFKANIFTFTFATLFVGYTYFCPQTFICLLFKEWVVKVTASLWYQQAEQVLTHFITLQEYVV